MDTIATPDKTSVSVTAPKALRVIKRNGDVMPFDADKIAVAMSKAFIAVEGDNAATSSRVRAFVCTSRTSRTRSSWR